jgi:predicted transcriptional regulator
LNITINSDCSANIIKYVKIIMIRNLNTESCTTLSINATPRLQSVFALQEEKIKNRSKLDIIYDILASAMGGVKKTHIMSRANLSSEQMNFYFNTLLHHSLLDAEKDSENNLVYRTTQKGIRFLHCCAQIKSLIAPIVKVRMQGELLFL